MLQSGSIDSRDRVRLIALIGWTFLATLAVFVGNRVALGDGTTNCDPIKIYPNSSNRNSANPCSAASCVVWSSTYAGTAPSCPQSSTTTVTKYDLSLTDLDWTNCGAPYTGSSSPPQCVEQLKPCGAWSFYTDGVGGSSCTLYCGSSNTLGYCQGSD